MTDAVPAEVAKGEVSQLQRRVGDRASVTRVRKPTATSRFGVSRRENHDSTEFYQRFPAPKIVEDNHISEPAALDEVWVGDARSMDEFGSVADASVALVVTSPPYYAGKEYEAAVGEGHIPESYIAYVEMLRDVFAECKRKLQPGGRIAVNVANLGRRPYRSLAADVIAVLQDLRFLIRGEIVWVKGKAAGGSCAWGSFQGPASPVLRDVTERIVLASKGRFDRARDPRDREAAGLPSVATISADEFMDLTTDVWELPPESATRIGHPAPFPVDLPRRLIDLYTYEDELVLDPFMGSGSTAVAAVRTGRHFVGFDTDPAYVAQAEERVNEERLQVREPAAPLRRPVRRGPSVDVDDDRDRLMRAMRQGRKVKDVALLALEDAGFRLIRKKAKPVAGVEVDLSACDKSGNPWYFVVVGSFSSSRPGLRRADVLWRVLGKASVLASGDAVPRFVVFTTDVPARNSSTARALAAVRGREPGKTVADVVQLVDRDDLARLSHYAKEG